MRSTTIKKMFLIDGLGALVSSLMLGIVLVNLESMIGMPTKILCWLATVAALFAAYSLTCYFTVPENGLLFLKIIALANALYIITTAGLVILLHQQLTLLGISYFVTEIAVVLVVIGMEWRLVRKG